MKNSIQTNQFKGLILKTTLFLFVLSMVFNFNIVFTPEQSTAQAATNLVKRESFEQADFKNYWTLWNNATSSRSYDFYRTFDAAFGYGSYSAAIDANGAPTDNFNAFMFGNEANNKFNVLSGEQYYLAFNAKADRNLDLVFFLRDAVSYSPVSPINGQTLSTSWQRYSFYITPTADTQAVLAFALGAMPDGSTIYLDGINLSKLSVSLLTPELSGYIGNTNKCLKFNDISPLALDEIEIELPYFDQSTGQANLKRFRPEAKVKNTACINFYQQTFSGIGTAYIKNTPVGQFNYTVLPKISLLIPAVPRADEDLTIEGSGFSPIDENTYVIVKAVDTNGKLVSRYIKPHTIDSSLSRAIVTLPLGVAQGKLEVQTSYLNTQALVKTSRSNQVSYRVKPVIFSLNWSERNFDQVGDNLEITGKGVSYKPTVIFYDDNDNVVAKKTAKVVRVTDEEVIAVQTPSNRNQLKITVVANGAESDKAGALAYSAKPRLNSIVSKNYRIVNGSSDRMQAAKIGEVITLKGQGFLYPGATTTVEFQGISGRVPVSIPSSDISSKKDYLNVTVPQAAQTGYITVLVNGQNSNFLPLEIIPTILSIAPDPVVPGQNITITASGVGDNLNLATVYFRLTKGEEVSRVPSSLSVDPSGIATIVVNTPLAMSNDSSTIRIQYNRWLSDATTALMIPPYITEAGIEPDSNVLIIKGYGFSINPKENKITYKYADPGHTIINPSVKMLGVYPTEEGQEIRVQILDDYHYGYVEVTVDGQTSNEFNFGPIQIRRVARRIQYVASEGREMGVLYISGYNFGPSGDVKVGSVWANTHYRTEFFIIAVVEVANVYDNPVIVTKL